MPTILRDNVPKRRVEGNGREGQPEGRLVKVYKLLERDGHPGRGEEGGKRVQEIRGEEARVRSCALCARSDPELSLKDKIQLFHPVLKCE